MIDRVIRRLSLPNPQRSEIAGRSKERWMDAECCLAAGTESDVAVSKIRGGKCRFGKDASCNV